MKEKSRILFFVICCFLVVACQYNEEEVLPVTVFKDYTVAIVRPSSSSEVRWQRVAKWALQNIEMAQQKLEKGVRLKLEWYDSQAEDVAILGKQLAERDDIAVVITLCETDQTNTLADMCSRTGKTLLAPILTSEETIRRYYGQDFLWALTETDITQCEMLLYTAHNDKAKTVSLLAPDNVYGKTFYDWFAFQATELGMTPVDIISYSSDNRDEYIKKVMTSGVDCVIATPTSYDDTKAILNMLDNDESCPDLLFSDAALTSELMSMDVPYCICGVAMYADPSSGFNIAYNVKYGENPLSSEASFYDALMLAAFDVADADDNNKGRNESLKRIIQTQEGSTEICAWNDIGMQRVFEALAQQKYLDISGATGSLAFDSQKYTNVTNSVYCQWMVYKQHILPLQYMSSQGTHRTSSTLANWNWEKTVEEIFEDKYTGIKYGQLNEQWALLVAASDGWDNYRHQADVLAIYQLLRKNGMDDDHIVLIMADDIASNEKNVNPGVIQNIINGDNLYQDIHLDYKLSSLTTDDIISILNGEQSNRLKEVIASDVNDNVLVFWSGHGDYGGFNWDGKGNGLFTREKFKSTLELMHSAQRYRKMLWLVETCHAGSVTSACQGIPGVLAIAASQPNETSKADVWSKEIQNYLSNTFTQSLMDALCTNTSISFRDLYYLMNKKTIASHIEVDNATFFDNLYRSSIEEFIITYKKEVGFIKTMNIINLNN